MGDRPDDPRFSRRRLLGAGGALAASASLGGCVGGLIGGGSQAETDTANTDDAGGDPTATADSNSTSGSDAAESLVTHERVGEGGTAIEYWTSTFYTPSREQSSQPAAASAIKAQHEEWAKEHPDYRIDLTYQTNLEQWEQTLLTRASRGDAPPGSTLDSFWIPNNYEYLQPLNDHVDDIDDFFPFVQETAVQDGDLLAAWKYTDCRCLYYDRQLMDQYNDGEAPRTWDDVIEVGGTITEEEDMAGYLYRNSAFDTLPLFWGQDASLVDDSGAPVLDDEANREAAISLFEYLRRTIDSGVTPQRVANITEYERLASEAKNGQAAMFVGGNWQISRDFKNQMEDDSWQRWQVAPIPMRGADQYATGVGGWAEGVYLDGNDDDRAAAAKSFAAKFVEPEAMGRYCEAASLLPTRQSLYEDDDLYASDVFPYQDRFQEFLEDGYARPTFPIYSTINSEWENAIGSVVTSQEEPASAVETMIGNVNAEYEA